MESKANIQFRNLKDTITRKKCCSQLPAFPKWCLAVAEVCNPEMHLLTIITLLHMNLMFYPRIPLKHQEISFELGVASLSKNLKEDEKGGTQTQESGPKKVLTGRKFLKVMCSTYTMADNWSLRQEEEEEEEEKQ